MDNTEFKLLNREISWLSFNERVLQEAEDPINPLVERMRFLGIFSNNLDEFFRVRVATIRRLIKLQNKQKIQLPESPQRVMNQIHETVMRQQRRFTKIYSSINKQLEDEKVKIIYEKELNKEQQAFVEQYFLDKVEPLLVPIMLKKVKKFPYLDDGAVYLFVAFQDQIEHTQQYGLIKVPRKSLSRFLVLPGKRDK